MRFLVDANLSPRVLPVLQAAGHTVTHVFHVGLGNATDEEILDHARRHDVVIVSSDTDFGALLARYQLSTPSFVLLRRVGHLGPEAQAELLLGVLPKVSDELDAGAIVMVSPRHLRLRALPITPAQA